MKTYSLRIALAGIVSLIVPATTFGASPLSGPIYNPANGHFYTLLTSDTWTASQFAALTLGGNLVTINDAAENAWVAGTFLNYGGITRDLWLGLNDVVQEGTFTWASGEPFSYSNWLPGQPDNGFGVEDYVHMYGGANPGDPVHVPGWFAGGWNDFDNSSGYITSGDQRDIFGLVEVPEPSTLSLLALGAALSLKLRKRLARSKAV